ncbi:cephalosporin hydroxylase, partial [Rhodobacter sp. 140A]
PSLSADLRNRHSVFALPQDERFLRVCELRCFRAFPLLSQPGKSSRKLQFQTIQFSGGKAITPAHDEETCTAVLDYFDPLLTAGDYMVIEDGAFRSDSDTPPGSSALSPPSRAIDAFLARRSQDYEIDARFCDSFGYNATFNFNGWLRRR